MVTPEPTIWSVTVGQNNIGAQATLLRARDKKLSFRVDDSSSLQFILDGGDAAFQYIQELISDVWVWRGSQVFWRGRLGPSSDNIDENSHTVQLNAFDYREWLGRQILGPGAIISWVGKTRQQIINDCLTYMNGLPGIKPTITLDATRLSTTTIDFDVLPGTTIKDLLAALTGFGWQVVPTSPTALSIIAVSPFYYRTNNYFVMEYGGAVAKVIRNLNTAAFANSVWVSGDMTLTPIMKDSSTIATDLMGRLGTVVSDPSIVKASSLTSRATQELSERDIIAADWKATLTAGAWINQSDAWLGDIVRFVVKSGRVNVNDMYRITEMEFAISDDGQDHQVDVTLVKPPYVPTGFETLEDKMARDDSTAAEFA